MAESKHLYVRMKLCSWKNAFECKTFPFPVDIQADSVGYLEVFDSYDAFKKLYPEEECFVIQTVE